jgi:hypothetical protein
MVFSGNILANEEYVYASVSLVSRRFHEYYLKYGEISERCWCRVMFAEYIMSCQDPNDGQCQNQNETEFTVSVLIACWLQSKCTFRLNLMYSYVKSIHDQSARWYSCSTCATHWWCNHTEVTEPLTNLLHVVKSLIKSEVWQGIRGFAKGWSRINLTQFI